MSDINQEEDGSRTVFVLPRQRANEKFRMRFNAQGHLEVSNEPPTDELSQMKAWVGAQGKPFSRSDFKAAFPLASVATLYRRLELLVNSGLAVAATGIRGEKTYIPVRVEAFN